MSDHRKKHVNTHRHTHTHTKGTEKKKKKKDQSRNCQISQITTCLSLLVFLFSFFSSLKQWHIKGLNWMYRGVISTGVEQVDLLPTEICLQRVEQLQNNRAPAAWVTAVEAPEQEGKVPLLQGPSGGRGGEAQPCWKFPPLATSGGQRWKLHKRPSVTCEY